MIAIVDYGMGNVGSIQNMLRKVGASAVLTADHETLEQAEKIILPGVGAFDHAVANLEQLGLIELLRQRVREAHLLGICLGMQLLADSSEEGNREGLGLIPGHVRRFRTEGHPERKVPHMGWNVVHPYGEVPLLRDVAVPHRFYFVHSYHFVCDDASDVAGTTPFGETFTSVVQRGRVRGVQFHPEKSHRYGIQLFRNFVAL